MTEFEHFSNVEGNVDHFYLDGAGFVTIGVGCLVIDPTGLPMLTLSTNVRAERADIFSDYNAVKALPGNREVAYYGKVCRLYLPQSAIRNLFDARLADFEKRLEVMNIDEMPPPVRLAVLDMAFNLGVSGLWHKFPKFCDALAKKDWATCARECRRKELPELGGISPERNEWTRRQFEQVSE